MKINIQNWRPYQVSDIFDVVYGVNLELNACDETVFDDHEGINFVSRSKENNGVTAYIKRVESVEPQAAGIITVAGGGSSVLSTFVQQEPFYSGRDLYLLIPKEKYQGVTFYSKQFICAVIMANKYKYSFGRQANKTLAHLEILLPDKDGTPDWQFMEQYIKSLHHKPLTTKNKFQQIPVLEVDEWKEFRVGDFFDIHPTKTIDGISTNDCVGYGVPLVVNSAENNGVAGLCDFEPTEKGGIITFSDTTDGNTFFYQPDDFIGFAHIQGMYPKTRQWTANQLLFFSTLLMFDSNGKYSYGRKMRRDTISNINIKLPVDSEGNPDWDFMDNYIKALPYGDRL